MTNGGPELQTAEELRGSFRPKTVRLLFVGESPPMGGTFFYKANSQAYRNMRSAFIQFDPQFACGFLDRFKAAGCYLDDLALHPIDKISDVDRRAARNAGIPSLAQRIRAAAPMAVVALSTGIWEHVRQAVELSGTRAKFYGVPFPGTGHQNRFLAGMTPLLPALLSDPDRKTAP